jgi:GMP synthase-like glutamine amidotransferase
MIAINPEGGRQVLVVQGRLLEESRQREQAILTPMISQAGREPIFVDGLTDNLDEIAQPSPFAEVILGGAGDCLLADLEGAAPANELARTYLQNTAAFLTKIISGAENLRIFGICFGHQIIAYLANSLLHPTGENIIQAIHSEVGTYPVFLTAEASASPLLTGVVTPIVDIAPALVKMVFGHKNSVAWLPPGATVLGTTAEDAFSGLVYDQGRIVTWQGHPELDGAQARLSAAAAHLEGTFGDSDHTEQIIINFLQNGYVR